MKNKISVIVPVYNVEKYIERCLDSLLNQTLNDIEIIIVNDGSTDSSKKIICSYKEKYPERIIYLEKTNGGLSDARNYALPFAQGEYVTFLDSDDYVEQDLYRRLYETAKQGNKKIVECDFYWEYPNKKVLDSVQPYHDVKDYLIRGRVVAWNKIYKRDWLLNSSVIFPKGLLYEDLEFFFSLIPQLDSINEIGYIQFAGIYYIQHKDSISYKESHRVVELCDIYHNIIQNLKNLNLFKTYYSEIEYKFARNALWGFPLKKVRFIKDRKTRKEILRIFWKDVNDIFPNWKKNKYLQPVSLANFYLRFITFALYNFIFMI